MTIDDFTRNLAGVNGGKDFDKEMLSKMYHAIHNEEIVMPAEHSGILRENYEWKVLLRRGETSEGTYTHAMAGVFDHDFNEEIVMPAEHSGILRENYEWKVLLRRGETSEGTYTHAMAGVFDHDLFSLVWGPVVAALSYAFDRSVQPQLVKKAVRGFRKCAMIAGHYGMSDVFDNLTITLCKFTTLLSSNEVSEITEGLFLSPEAALITFGGNAKAHLALQTVFALAHKHGDILREGWKNLLECILHLFKAKALPKCLIEGEDFVDPSGKVSLIREDAQSQASQRTDSGLLISLYSYITSDATSTKGPTPEEEQLLKAAKNCVKECYPEQLITESKFLRIESLQELVKALILASARQEPGGNFDDKSTIFFMEMLVKVVLQNRDRAQAVWKPVCDHVCGLICSASGVGERAFLLERCVVSLLCMATRLMRREELTGQILGSLRVLFVLLSPDAHFRFPTHGCSLKLHREISFGLHELLKTNAANIHSGPDWTILFSLLECFGAGARPLPALIPIAFKGHHASKKEGFEESVGRGSLSDAGQTSAVESSSWSSGDRGYLSDSEVFEQGSAGENRRGRRMEGAMNRVPSADLVYKPSPPPPPINDDPTQSSGWLWVGKDGEMEPVIVSASSPHPILGAHDPAAFLRSCDTLTFLVRDAAHVTPFNFAACLRCIKTFVEASIDTGSVNDRLTGKELGNSRKKKTASNNAGRRGKESSHAMKARAASPTAGDYKSGDGSAYDADESDSDDLPGGYHQAAIQLLDLLHTLHTRAANIFSSWAEEGEASVYLESLWETAWCPLLQAIARLCCDHRCLVRTNAVTSLQRALLVPDLQVLTPLEWEGCFHRVLFPLLGELLASAGSPGLSSLGPVSGLEETRMRAATLLSKVFLQHLTPLLALPTFTALWLSILDCMEKFLSCDSRTDLLCEAIPESLKNMLLVMETAGVFRGPEAGSHNQLWDLTWERISAFMPSLKEELSRAQMQRPVLPLTTPASGANDGENWRRLDGVPESNVKSVVETGLSELTEAVVSAASTPATADEDCGSNSGGFEIIGSASTTSSSPIPAVSEGDAKDGHPTNDTLVEESDALKEEKGVDVAKCSPLPLLLTPHLIEPVGLPVFSPQHYFGASSNDGSPGDDFLSGSKH
ncbi:unnamed protein product [Notodromas monacha]|uniref:Golgi-specific brefeldin A-resistance guanine nucleotide exchange factor 1 n=1 Tax=Notodromas monacha TaxID=399045 RepID=A0A7R9BLX4_9CRUS|nr:unnamed protein product [Notodromas monacha]CAG0916827.1 unnamed protein product [Notodromas monacha]